MISISNRTVWAIILLAGICVNGCQRGPQIDSQNRRLLESLKTAVMAKNPDWLKKNVEKIDALHKDGKLSEPEYEALQEMIREAQGGNWSIATEKIQQLAKGQNWSR